MRLPPFAAPLWKLVRSCLLVGSAAVAGCGLTLDVDPRDLLDASSQPGLDGGERDGGAHDGGGPHACAEDLDCLDDLHCNGEEACVGGICMPGSSPCGPTAPCVVSTCHEGSRACIESDLTCAGGQVCDPASGECRAAPTCTETSDCGDDGIACNGVFSCVEGTCVAEAVACADADGIACTAPTCSLDGCIELADDALCADARPGDCVVPRCTESGCAQVQDDVLCDDGIPCTTDTCNPGATEDPTGCIHAPDDSLCASMTVDACGTMVCVGDRALAGYPALAGCAPDLSSARCGGGAFRCVVAAGATVCESYADACASHADCDDTNPCNGEEICAGGRCARGRFDGCPPVTGSTSWCDRSSGVPTCEYRVGLPATTS